ncbi:MAG: mandelate racemase/muconate lactonizing enzyme family protein [Thaumarchaeota archaeon]|nr:mandelate racemase/muconate lactonizing enzyme family protein [Nitrososphaerota archaeon]
MRLESLEAFPIVVKVDEKLRAGTFTYSQYQTVVVKAVCDGVGGWGEAMTRFEPEATALLVRYFGRQIMGSEFATPGVAWGKLWKELRVRGHTRGIDVEALSGVEMALFDCYGKLKRSPISKLLFKDSRSSVEVYAGSIFQSRGPLEGQISRAKNAGMKGAKVKVGFGVKKDEGLMRLARRAWPDGMLVADANGAYDAKSALKACELLKRLGLEWFEEPVPSDDWEGYRLLRGNGVPIGAGEAWFGGDLQYAVENELIDILEPSVSRCGGIGVLADAAKLARREGLGFSPMTGANSAISLAASLQVACAFPTVGVETSPFPNPLLHDLAHGFHPAKNGAMRVPTGPGLGIEVDESFVRKAAAV